MSAERDGPVIMLTVRGSLPLPKCSRTRAPHRLVVAGDVVRVDHDDVGVGQEVERRRIVRARRPCTSVPVSATPREGVADRRRASCAVGRRRSRRSSVRLALPRQRREPRIVAARGPARQIVRAQIARDRGRHVGGVGDAARRVRGRAPRPSGGTARRALAARSWPRAGMTPRGALARRSATARAARRLVAGDAERLADRCEARRRGALIALRPRASTAPGRSRPAAPGSRGAASSRRRAAASGSGRRALPNSAERAHRERASRAGRAAAAWRRRPRTRRPVAHASPGERCALELALAPVAHQLRQRDAHRADLSQRPQKVEAFGRWPAFSTPISAGVSTAPIGPG